jgi:hypothetical protein
MPTNTKCHWMHALPPSLHPAVPQATAEKKCKEMCMQPGFTCGIIAAAYPNMCGCDHGPQPAFVYDTIRENIKVAMNEDLELIGPTFIRLAWHSAATYDAENTPHGGATGATMRFRPESEYEDNNGLDVSDI